MRKVLPGILLIGLFYYVAATGGPRAAGIWQDDGVYLATAKAIAEGRSYRHIEDPDEPLQTKYPILYPAVLALGFAVWGDYPQNMALLLAPGVAAAVGFAVLAWIYLRKVLGVSRGWTVVIVALAALSPEIVSLVRFAMSDLPYALLSVAALVCLDHKHRIAASPSRRWIWLIASGLLIAAATLTRSFGVTLTAAAVLTLLLRRKFAAAGALLAVVVAVMLPWWVWQSWAAHANGPIQTSPMHGYDLNYALWLPSGIEELTRVVRQNFFRTIFALSYSQLALPREWVMEAIREWSWRTVVFHLLCYAAAATVLA